MDHSSPLANKLGNIPNSETVVIQQVTVHQRCTTEDTCNWLKSQQFMKSDNLPRPIIDYQTRRHHKGLCSSIDAVVTVLGFTARKDPTRYRRHRLYKDRPPPMG